MTVTFYAPTGLGGALTPPPDKSITHRCLLLAAASSGTCLVRNPLETGDCFSTRRCLAGLGVEIRADSPAGGESPGGGNNPAGGDRPAGALRVQGRGLRGFVEPEDVLDAGNSGTTMRLLSGLLAGQGFYAVMSGDDSLRHRPMLRVVEPLRRMGAEIRGRQGGNRAPLSFLPGGGTLRAGVFELPVASAQVKSALLLAALRGDGQTVLEGRLDSRDHTECLLEALGLPLRRSPQRLSLRPVAEIPPFDLAVPGDISSAAFFLTASAICGKALEVQGCGLNPTRLGFVQVLRRMGLSVELRVETRAGGEPAGSLRLEPGRLAGATVGAAEVPWLIDEVPLLAVLGLFADGVTAVRGAGELRHKESDRLGAVARLIEAVGGRLLLREDGFEVEGPQRHGLRFGTVDPRGDHRIAMAAAVLSAGIPAGVAVAGFEAASVSYPEFVRDFRSLGGTVE